LKVIKSNVTTLIKMLAWRLNWRSAGSSITYHQTPFTTNPKLFYEMFINVLTDNESEKEYICDWDKLQQFNESELTTKYCCQGEEKLFQIKYSSEDLIIYEIETIEILV
jgi:hypothetical protein